MQEAADSLPKKPRVFLIEAGARGEREDRERAGSLSLSSDAWTNGRYPSGDVWQLA